MKQFLLRSLLLGATLAACARLSAQTSENLVSNGDFNPGLEPWTLTDPGKARISFIDSGLPEAPRAVRLDISADPAGKPWSVQLRQKLGAAWKKGEPLRLVAWMRSARKSRIRPIVEGGAAVDFAKSLTQEITLSPEWTRVDVAGAATGDFEAGGLTLGFHLGYGPGSVEMTGVRLTRGNAAASPMAPNAAVQSGPSLDKPQDLIAGGDFSADVLGMWSFSKNSPRVSLVDVQAQGFKRALRLKIDAATPHPWDVRAAAPKVRLPLVKGTIVGVRIWARSPQKAQLGVRYQRAQAPYDKILSQNVTLSPDWKEYRFYGRVPSDLPAESTQFEFHLGYGAGTVELANVRVQGFGPGTVADAEARLGAQTIAYWLDEVRDESWRKSAFARIDKHRKGDIRLRVVNTQGKPVANAKIKLVQTRQLFRWGSAVNAERLTDSQSADNMRYQAEVKRLFNTVVFENDLKWKDDSATRTARALEAIQWLRANNIAVRGHTLVWGSRQYLPRKVAENWGDTETLRRLVRERVREAAQTWKGQLYVWDAVNEAVTNTELWDKLGWDEFANVFKIARAVDPAVRLAYNDYNIANEVQSLVSNTRHRGRVVELVRLLQSKGAPVDILGDQAHFGVPLTPPARVVEIWAEMAKLGLALEVTEYDAAIPDDKVHGEYTRDILIAAFAEPRVSAFLMWGFWAGAHWRAGEGGAMFHKDWTPRPAQRAYEELVLKQWMTRAEVTTGRDGTAATRGFLGDYEAVITAGGRTKRVPLTLGTAGLRQQIVF